MSTGRTVVTVLVTCLVFLLLTACVGGVVMDEVTGEAVPNAVIQWSNSAGNTGSIEADEDGLFAISGTKPVDGEVEFTVSADGYQTETFTEKVVRNSLGFAMVVLHITSESEVTTETLSSGLTAYILGETQSYRPDTTIVLDDDSNPHVVYSSPEGLVYIHKTGSTWVATNLQGYGRPWGDHSTALDSNGQIHIAATGSAGGNPGEDLVYLTNSSESWEFIGVDTDYSVGLDNDLTLDKDGNVHISYYDWAQGRLKYATNSSGTWETQVLGDARWKRTAIMIDSHDSVHIVYESWSGIRAELGYITNSSGNWVKEETGIYSTYPVTAMGKNDNIYILNGSRLSSNRAGEWDYEDIDWPVSSLFGTDEDSMTADSSGKLHVSFVGSDFLGPLDQPQDPNRRIRHLFYATNLQGTWEVVEIDDRQYNENDSPSITVDSEGKVHMVYVQETDHKVRYVTFDPEELLSSPQP